MQMSRWRVMVLRFAFVIVKAALSEWAAIKFLISIAKNVPWPLRSQQIKVK